MREKKEPFKFKYTYPSLDWYDVKEVVINYDDYYYFKIQRRYGPSWWLIGTNPPKDKNKFEWTETQLGEIEKPDLIRFIKWAKDKDGGSRITEINSLSGDFDIIKDVLDLLKGDDNIE